MRASLFVLCVGIATAVVALPLPTEARPSLVDLDADLAQVVDGLCHGDAALCGQAAPTTVAGQLDFDAGSFQMDFRSLRFGYTKLGGGSFGFDDLTATVDTPGLTALLVGSVRVSTIYDVEIIVPDPTGPGSVTLLSLQNVTIEDISVDSSGATASITLAFSVAEISWLGATSSWNVGLSSGAGCIAAGGDKHVALAGNPAILLTPGQIEVSYFLFASGPGIGFAFERAPAASSACYLRATATGANVPETVQRMSPLSETFSTPLYDETIEFTNGVHESYALTIEGTEMRERFVYSGSIGTLTTRTFSPIDGSLASETSEGL